MASKQVQDILIKLGIQGFEGLDKLKSSFRELEKAVGPSNTTIEKARRSIVEFGDASSRTEQLIKGQLEAFKGLRGQAEIGSATYNKLTNSIATLEVELRGSSAAIDQQRESITRATGASERNARALQQQIRALTELQRQARPGSSAFAQLGKDIDNAKTKLNNLSSEAAQFNRTLSAGFGATPEVLGGQIAALRRGLSGLRFDSEKYLETLERIRLLSVTQAGRTGRAEVIAGFQAFQSPIFQGGYADPSRLPGLPNTTAALEQQLSELAGELANVERGSARYVDVSNRMADIQRELRFELTGTAEAFRQLDIAQAGVERRADKIAGVQEYYRTQGPMAPGVGGYRDPVTGAMIAAGARTPGRIRVEESAYATPIGPQPFPEAGRRAQESIRQAMDDVNRIYEDARIRRVELQSKYDQIQIDKMLEGLDLEGRVREKGFRDELATFDRQLEARDRRRSRAITAGQAVQAAGAVISGGIFGGPEGFLGGVGGAIAGSLIPGLGTVGGSFAGAAIGAQVGAFRQQLGIAADYAAQLEKLRIALRNVTQSSSEYNQALGVIRQYSQELAIPQDVITKSFTQLTASVIGAGGSVKDAEVAFRGIAAGIRGTGGSVENLNAAVTATAQVFSKGKVSAEELRGQIGERLPGAFSLFAESIGKTPQQLDKALEQGQVSLLDFKKFAEKLFEEYGESAKQIASGPEAAGDRLKTSLSNLSESVGTLLRPIGAEFQTVFAQIVSSIDAGVRKLNEFLGRGRQGEINEAQRNLDATERRIKQLQERIAERPGMGATRDFTVTLAQMQARRAQQFGRLKALLAADMSARGVTNEATERPGLPGITASTQKDKADKAAREAAKARNNLFQELLARIQAQNNLLTQQGRLNEIIAKTESDRAKEALKAAEEILLNQEQQLDLRFKFGEVSKDVYSKEKAAIAKQGEVVRAEFAKTARNIEEKADKIYRELFDPGGAFSTEELSPFEKALDELRRKITAAEAEFKGLGGVKAEKGLADIAGLKDEDYTKLATRTVIGGDIKSLEEQVMQLQRMGSELSTLDQLVIKYGNDWDDLDAGLKAHLTSLAEQKDRLEMIRETVGSLAQSIQGAIGSAMSTAVSSLVTGAENIKTTLASMFEAIGKAFIDMATQIIAKQLVMITLGTISKALGFSNPAGSGGPNPAAGVGQYPMPNATGNVYAQNGIQPFASGGIVTKPTFFKFANGGAMSTGVMGEAGPEAIMPLTRGADGKLGVVAKLNAAKSKYSVGSSTAAEEAAAFAAQAQSDAAFGTAQINISGGTLVFNDQNYVKADQIPAIISQSSKMGQAMAIKQLQMSATTRKKLGL